MALPPLSVTSSFPVGSLGNGAVADGAGTGPAVVKVEGKTMHLFLSLLPAFPPFHPLYFAIVPYPELFEDCGYLVPLAMLTGRCKISFCTYLYTSTLHRNLGACRCMQMLSYSVPELLSAPPQAIPMAGIQPSQEPRLLIP